VDLCSQEVDQLKLYRPLMCCSCAARSHTRCRTTIGVSCKDGASARARWCPWKRCSRSCGIRNSPVLLRTRNPQGLLRLAENTTSQAKLGLWAIRKKHFKRRLAGIQGASVSRLAPEKLPPRLRVIELTGATSLMWAFYRGPENSHRLQNPPLLPARRAGEGARTRREGRPRRGSG